MIKYEVGNILESQTEALVNTVNTYGVMGKGIALAFKKFFPANYKSYRQSFERKELAIGKMHFFNTGLLTPRYIINFPTKKHWRHKSQIQYIEEGLVDLIKVIHQNNIQSISIPPLGCGNGGLQWEDVKHLIIQKLEPISKDREIVIFEPGFNLSIRSTKAITKLNATRAMYLQIIRRYELLGEEITTLVVQKLAYLLQRMGEPLNLRFEKGRYGPFASNLNKMIEALSPNYLEYTGDLSTPTTVIHLVSERKEETNNVAENSLQDDQHKRLDSVLKLIEGFENSFGLELLATVAYAIEECPECTKPEIISDIHNWTQRKRQLMSEHLISVSYDRLKEFSL